MNLMFYRATHFNQNIGNWDVSSVKGMKKMFMDAINFNQDISMWNVSNLQDTKTWNVLSPQDMINGMFEGATNMEDRFIPSIS